MKFDVHVVKPPALISDSAGHGSRRTYAAVARVRSQGKGFLDVVAVYCHGYCDQHEEVEILDGLLALLVVSAPVSNPRLILAQFPEDLPTGWEDAWEDVEAAVLALPE
jgi:hypothetical protein